jgi:hypothetical protein
MIEHKFLAMRRFLAMLRSMVMHKLMEQWNYVAILKFPVILWFVGSKKISTTLVPLTNPQFPQEVGEGKQKQGEGEIKNG